jgi:flagellum-specific ATP synthase
MTGPSVTGPLAGRGGRFTEARADGVASVVGSDSDRLLSLFQTCADQVGRCETARPIGTVTRVAGPLVESQGPLASVGEICHLHIESGQPPCLAEVVGFRDHRLLLLAYGAIHGLRAGVEVRATGASLQVPVGPGLLGRIIDGLGRPLDDRGPLRDVEMRSVQVAIPHPLQRARIECPLSTGVRAIDAFLTIGRGQRMGIFAGSGVGKSVLLGTIAQQTDADVSVVALVGERGREVREFLERDLTEAGLERSVVVVATADEPALMRVKAAIVATRIAAAYRRSGRHVLLLMDSLTRVAMAQREIGLVVGEPPTSKGYTPSVFALLSQVLERAGTDHHGSVTGLYTVLVEGDDMGDPIADSARSILDGHVVLSRRLAHRNHYPAIDVLESVSRLLPEVTTPEHRQNQGQVREWLAAYREVEELLQLGAYVPGHSAVTDQAIDRMPEILRFLKQSAGIGTPLAETSGWLSDLTTGRPR